jgi:hypothetical protein
VKTGGRRRGDGIVGARRLGARLDAVVELRAAFLDPEAGRGADLPPLSFYGRTRDLSEGGLGVVVPLVSFDPRSCSRGLPVRIRIDTPGGTVEVKAEAVHCRLIVDRGLREDCLVGARLVGGDARELVRRLTGGVAR